MEVWESIQTIEKKFDEFFESIPKADRIFLAKCSSREYDGYIKKNYPGENQ